MYSGYSSIFGRWRFESTSSTSSACQPNRSARCSAASWSGRSKWSQVRSPLLSSSGLRSARASTVTAPGLGPPDAGQAGHTVLSGSSVVIGMVEF